MTEFKLKITEVTKSYVAGSWDAYEGADSYRVYWADTNRETTKFLPFFETEGREFTFERSTHISYTFKVEALSKGSVIAVTESVVSPKGRVLKEQLETIGRGVAAVKVNNGVFVTWRMFKEEVKGAGKTGLTGTDYKVLRDGKEIALVTDSCNYLDKDGSEKSLYSVVPVDSETGKEGLKSTEASVLLTPYFDIPLKRPAGGVNPAGQEFSYNANDLSVGDVDGDGEYEYFLKWDPDNSHDVSHRGYTGHQLIDCYKLDGTLLWRLDMGDNIRAGAHYTQFMVYDFNGDGKAEIAVKTAPGTKITRFDKEGNVTGEEYITLPESDLKKGVSHSDNYVCSAEDFLLHIKEMFKGWSDREEVKNGTWPKTLEECFGVKPMYSYPLSDEDASKLTDYFVDVYAPKRSEKNELRKFEGFIYEGPEYLTMFSGDGYELETIPYRFPRVDDGLLWGDYAFRRIEPCNRVDRFNSCVAYLDGERPYLVMCRGYYTRATLVAYDFFDNKFNEVWAVDSGFVKMSNPFNDEEAHDVWGSDEKYGILCGQGNHSVSTADVDGDGCMEIIYGAAVIDHDGSVLYSSTDIRPDGVRAKLGHGDAMHVGRFDPDRPGFQIFNVFEGARAVPFGYAYRDAETGKAFFGEPATSDLGRCMVGKVRDDIRGYQMWVKNIMDLNGKDLNMPRLGTNMCIRFAPDLTTQVTDGVEYVGHEHTGIVNDIKHGIMLVPEDTMTNNGTKGNPCLVADLFGDYREELVLRTKDNEHLRIYLNTDISNHKLYTLLQDTMYRCGVAWQNNCYNQPCYTKFYYGSDMDFNDVLNV
ncbi:MAG: rhamnogalacturonan lyase [Lachnospiraceae bacterium]|nr:rhamnogalacturonan lyase [Lachnospiraceae bacterium]